MNITATHRKTLLRNCSSNCWGELGGAGDQRVKQIRTKLIYNYLQCNKRTLEFTNPQSTSSFLWSHQLSLVHVLISYKKRLDLITFALYFLLLLLYRVSRYPTPVQCLDATPSTVKLGVGTYQNYYFFHSYGYFCSKKHFYENLLLDF